MTVKQIPPCSHADVIIHRSNTTHLLARSRNQRQNYTKGIPEASVRRLHTPWPSRRIQV